MKLKKYCYLLLIASLLVTFLQPAMAAERKRDGNFYYEEYPGYVRLVGYAGDAKEITIPNFIMGYPVSEIGPRCFDGCESLEEIYIPDTVMSIDPEAFIYILSLKRIVSNAMNVTILAGPDVEIIHLKLTPSPGAAKEPTTAPTNAPTEGQGTEAPDIEPITPTTPATEAPEATEGPALTNGVTPEASLPTKPPVEGSGSGVLGPETTPKVTEGVTPGTTAVPTNKQPSGASPVSVAALVVLIVSLVAALVVFFKRRKFK